MTGKRRVAVLGSGSWGTALAQHLDRVGHEVVLWGRDPKLVEKINSAHENTKYLPGFTLSPSIVAEADISRAVRGSSLVVFVVPSYVLHEVVLAAKPSIGADTVLVSAIKGLENETLKQMSAILHEELGANAKVAVLSGPSFAREVFQGLPTAVTMAASDLKIAEEAAAYFHIDSFRVYTSDDLVGVELGGALKNVIALAAGVVEGMGMGSSARAALITRGLVEIQRLTVALGGRQETVTGLSGLGDLLVTATGDLSRNRQVGLRLGRGEKLEETIKSVGQVAEGVRMAPKAAEIARRLNVKAPIVEEVAKIISGQSEVPDSVRRLLSRAPAAEKN